MKANRDHLTRKEGNTNNLINQNQDKIKLGKDVKTDRATGPSEANARSSQADGVPFGPKEVPLRLTEDHQARAIQIDKGLSQTDKELTQAISSQICPPKVDKGSCRVNAWPSQSNEGIYHANTGISRANTGISRANAGLP